MIMAGLSARALHWVFKVGDRASTIRFYRDLLGMRILRHEEFQEGCKAACNGPYDGCWSKTMVGYGPEDSHFVVELTYNYGLDKYRLGNDFRGIKIRSSNAVARAKQLNWDMHEDEPGVFTVCAPGGYKFFLVDAPEPENGSDPVECVRLGVTELDASLKYWRDELGMRLLASDARRARLQFASGQAQLQLEALAEPMDHGTAFGRIAFAVDASQLAGAESRLKAAGYRILTPLVSLDTPGKATVQVVILADPDGHEICFVGDEAFRQLSKVDPEAVKALEEAMDQDKSNEWFAKKGKEKASAE